MEITVQCFFEQAREQLALEVVAGGAGMGRAIKESAINRPGLALTGFFKYFAHKRIQVLGLLENTYLGTLPPGERPKRLAGLFERHIPCLIVARHRKVLPEVCELADMWGVPVLRSPVITSRLINGATLVMENLTAPRMRRQGTMVDILGVGVMIEGKPGIGKSETALALVEKGYGLVADDVTELRLASTGVIYGSSVSVTRYHMQIRGLGIIHVPSLFGVTAVSDEKSLDLVISLVTEAERGGRDESGLVDDFVDVLGRKVPRVSMHVAPGRDMAYLVEVAAHNQKLKLLGHNAAKEFDSKLMATLAANGETDEQPEK